MSNGREGHIYYNNQENMVNNVCIAKLDRDNVYGYGLETTTIYNDETRDYTFYVLNYSKEADISKGRVRFSVKT